MKKEPEVSTDCMLTKSEHEQLFNYLYTELYENVYGCALYYCRSTETAKDLTQDVFMRVWSHIERLTIALGSLGNMNNWENYLFIMTKNVTLNYRQKSGNELKAKIGYCKDASNVAQCDRMLEKEYEQLLNQALIKLTKRQSDVYFLNQYGVKRDAIAEKMGITYSTVNNTLNDARKRLRKHIKEQMGVDMKRYVWLTAA